VRRPSEILTADEIGQLLRACGRGRTGIRNRALLVLLWRSGLRISEALALRPADVDHGTGAIRVLRGKGDRARTAAIDSSGLAWIVAWAPYRPTGARWLFCTLQGRRLAPSYVRGWLGRLRARTGLAKRVHAHGLRHTYAVELAREGVPLHTIQGALGHAHASTTAVYLAHYDPRELLAVAAARGAAGAERLAATAAAAPPAVPNPPSSPRPRERAPAKRKASSGTGPTKAPTAARCGGRKARKASRRR
jgi:site-specific recombinase XerD